jgi:hypothetical protein
MRRETQILLIILIVLGAVYLIVQRPFSSSLPETPTGSDLFFPDFVAADVETLSARGQGIDVTLFRTSGGWMIAADRTMHAAPDKVEAALDMISALPKTELVSVVPEKHVVFDVTEGPATRLEARGGGRLLADVFVGKRGPGHLAAYVRAPGDDEVYLSQRGFPSNVVRPADFWRDREILSFEPAEVTWVAIESRDERVALSRTGETEWRMAEPEERRADATAIDAALRVLSSLSASGFEDALPPAECGFDDPTAVISIDLASGALPTVTIGASDETSYFVRREGRETIYRVPVSRLERVLVGADGFAADEG